MPVCHFQKITTASETEDEERSRKRPYLAPGKENKRPRLEGDHEQINEDDDSFMVRYMIVGLFLKDLHFS